jgi:predicted dinucleotide-binding enzyme
LADANRLGIIGAGDIGGHLARWLTALGHDVAVANPHGPHTLSAPAEETGARQVGVEEAARGACLTRTPPLS